MSERAHDLDEATGASTTAVTESKLPALFRNRGLGWVLIVLGGIGLIASFSLTLEYLHALTEPDAELLCDISIFVTCQPAMMSSAGAVLGFPNIILGLVCFTIAVVTGVVLTTGAKLPSWYLVIFNIGLLGGAVLITYLQWFSGFQLRALCLWCMIIWAATIPLMTLTTVANLAQGRFGKGLAKPGQALTGWAWVIVVIWYLAVIGLVLAGMWDAIRLSMI
ncbi:vitamin K epoxide reductase family protein [Gulosibacter chungangensis]|uniref:Vitamin K epoxide reductase family protein n=1 Tax=Gulosibacter chungangensis TaxID=979746 RepID=A0A7J5B7U0_9MICO|nr:vitamin K epoxide reductase family protein [Gulosibacter chungangensis]KAB1641147.1 vitamin K epoxide reductase family protein [Gulosibacter chungangensis]